MPSCKAIACCIFCCFIIVAAIVVAVVVAILTSTDASLDDLLGNITNLPDFFDDQNITDSIGENFGNVKDSAGDKFGDWRDVLADNGASLKDNLGSRFNDLIPEDWDQFNNFTNVLDTIRDRNFGDFYRPETDPFVGDNSTMSWPTEGMGGLSLKIINALDDDWQVEFNTAITDWENGSPDTLSLTAQFGEVDHTCTPVEDKMKVCNANFGDTGWLGINEILSFDNGFVISSVAKMNEFYLKNAAYEKRQFTMCHEIGHGFGLPHTDENFANADLGNCMDYTNRPENNMKPDISNYNRLASIYGTVNDRRRLRNTGIDNHHKNNKQRSIPLDITKAYDHAIGELHSSFLRRNEEQDHRIMKEATLSSSSSSWRVLREHSYGREYVKRLLSSSETSENSNSNAYVLKVSVLFNS